jgi:hypothetical protein
LHSYGEDEVSFLRRVTFNTVRRSLRVRLWRHINHTPYTPPRASLLLHMYNTSSSPPPIIVQSPATPSSLVPQSSLSSGMSRLEEEERRIDAIIAQQATSSPSLAHGNPTNIDSKDEKSKFHHSTREADNINNTNGDNMNSGGSNVNCNLSEEERQWNIRRHNERTMVSYLTLLERVYPNGSWPSSYNRASTSSLKRERLRMIIRHDIKQRFQHDHTIVHTSMLQHQHQHTHNATHSHGHGSSSSRVAGRSSSRQRSSSAGRRSRHDHGGPYYGDDSKQTPLLLGVHVEENYIPQPDDSNRQSIKRSSNRTSSRTTRAISSKREISGVDGDNDKESIAAIPPKVTSGPLRFAALCAAPIVIPPSAVIARRQSISPSTSNSTSPSRSPVLGKVAYRRTSSDPLSLSSTSTSFGLDRGTPRSGSPLSLSIGRPSTPNTNTNDESTIMVVNHRQTSYAGGYPATLRWSRSTLPLPLKSSSLRRPSASMSSTSAGGNFVGHLRTNRTTLSPLSSSDSPPRGRRMQRSSLDTNMSGSMIRPIARRQPTSSSNRASLLTPPPTSTSLRHQRHLLASSSPSSSAGGVIGNGLISFTPSSGEVASLTLAQFASVRPSNNINAASASASPLTLTSTQSVPALTTSAAIATSLSLPNEPLRIGRSTSSTGSTGSTSPLTVVNDDNMASLNVHDYDDTDPDYDDGGSGNDDDYVSDDDTQMAQFAPLQAVVYSDVSSFDAATWPFPTRSLPPTPSAPPVNHDMTTFFKPLDIDDDTDAAFDTHSLHVSDVTHNGSHRHRSNFNPSAWLYHQTKREAEKKRREIEKEEAKADEEDLDVSSDEDDDIGILTTHTYIHT